MFWVKVPMVVHSVCIKSMWMVKWKKRGHFTGTLFHTGGTEAELLVGVRFGLIRHRVIDGRSGAVVFTCATVVKVPASLRGRREKRWYKLTPSSGWNDLKYKCERKHTRQSESLGPVQPAAHWTWQQSLASRPLQRLQPDVQGTLVTNKTQTYVDQTEEMCNSRISV